jgi:hypothetical protein
MPAILRPDEDVVRPLEAGRQPILQRSAIASGETMLRTRSFGAGGR